MTTPVVTVGQGAYTYVVDKQWGRGPDGLPEFGMVSGVAGDSLDRVYLFIRTPVAEVLVFHPNGTLLTRWGDGSFVQPHMLFISSRDEVYATDIAAHIVTRWTLDGKLLQRWAPPGQHELVRPADKWLRAEYSVGAGFDESSAAIIGSFLNPRPARSMRALLLRQPTSSTRKSKATRSATTGLAARRR